MQRYSPLRSLFLLVVLAACTADTGFGGQPLRVSNCAVSCEEWNALTFDEQFDLLHFSTNRWEDERTFEVSERCLDAPNACAHPGWNVEAGEVDTELFDACIEHQAICIGDIDVDACAAQASFLNGAWTAALRCELSACGSDCVRIDASNEVASEYIGAMTRCDVPAYSIEDFFETLLITGTYLRSDVVDALSSCAAEASCEDVVGCYTALEAVL